MGQLIAILTGWLTVDNDFYFTIVEIKSFGSVDLSAGSTSPSKNCECPVNNKLWMYPRETSRIKQLKKNIWDNAGF